MLRNTILLLALCLGCLPAKAAAPYVAIEQRLSADQLHATGLDTLSAQQLRTLNSLLQQDTVKMVEETKAAQPPNENERGLSSLIGLNDQPIKSRLKGAASSWEPGTVFELENGQQWKVLKGSGKLRKPVESPEIVVVPGIAGRWFFQINEDMPRPRVYLIN